MIAAIQNIPENAPTALKFSLRRSEFQAGSPLSFTFAVGEAQGIYVDCSAVRKLYLALNLTPIYFI